MSFLETLRNAAETYRTVILIVMISMSIVSTLLFVLDKNLARSGGWRISEPALWFFTIFFGAVGSYIGMKLMHHKTHHKNFKRGVPLLAILQLVILLIGMLA